MIAIQVNLDATQAILGAILLARALMTLTRLMRLTKMVVCELSLNAHTLHGFLSVHTTVFGAVSRETPKMVW